MFDFVRKNTKILQFVLFLLIFPSFVLFGVEGYTRMSDRGPVVASVGRDDIRQSEWDAAHKQEADRLRQQMPQPPGVEPGELDGVIVVEGEEGGLVACGNARQFGQASVSLRNRISRRLTSAACSCCTQWPAPSTMWISFMLVQALFCIFSSAPGDW